MNRKYANYREYAAKVANNENNIKRCFEQKT